MKSRFGAINTLVLIVFLGCLFFVLAWWFWANQPVCSFLVSRKECPQASFTIKKGQGVEEIASLLAGRKIIRNPLAFKIQVLKLGLAKKIQAGEFSLSMGETPVKIAQALTKGNFDKKVILIEGLRSEEVAEILVSQGFVFDLKEWQQKVSELELEGKLFPDTYMIKKEASVSQIISLLTKNFEKKFDQSLVKEALLHGIDAESVLILASLVEREVKSKEDRPVVAGVLLKRLEKNWPLQVDATVQYALATRRCPLSKTNCDWWPQKLTGADLKVSSPFNTYFNRGLPPGPICSPGLEAIRAVIYPQSSDYWFYLSDNQGKIHYAKTLEEHSENVQQFLKR